MSPRLLLEIALAAVMLGPSLLNNNIAALPTANAFAATHSLSSPSSSLHAMNKRTNKFNKQKDLAAKMAEAKRQRELTEGPASETRPEEVVVKSVMASATQVLSAEDIKLRNDRQRFADLLENSLTSGGGGDFDRGYYLTVEQENENADAVCKLVLSLLLFSLIFVVCE